MGPVFGYSSPSGEKSSNREPTCYDGVKGTMQAIVDTGRRINARAADFLDWVRSRDVRDYQIVLLGLFLLVGVQARDLSIRWSNVAAVIVASLIA